MRPKHAWLALAAAAVGVLVWWLLRPRVEAPLPPEPAVPPPAETEPDPHPDAKDGPDERK